jgi:hypothetical protein
MSSLWFEVLEDSEQHDERIRKFPDTMEEKELYLTFCLSDLIYSCFFRNFTRYFKEEKSPLNDRQRDIFHKGVAYTFYFKDTFPLVCSLYLFNGNERPYYEYWFIFRYTGTMVDYSIHSFERFIKNANKEEFLNIRPLIMSYNMNSRCFSSRRLEFNEYFTLYERKIYFMWALSEIKEVVSIDFKDSSSIEPGCDTERKFFVIIGLKSGFFLTAYLYFAFDFKDCNYNSFLHASFYEKYYVTASKNPGITDVKDIQDVPDFISYIYSKFINESGNKEHLKSLLELDNKVDFTLKMIL